jgi:hypothetical protein
MTLCLCTYYCVGALAQYYIIGIILGPAARFGSASEFWKSNFSEIVYLSIWYIIV